MNVQRRLNLGFAALFLLFVAFLVVPVGLGERQRADHERQIARIGRAQLANDEVLQRMTDAETGVRGFLLTGEPLFLQPYQGAAGAAAAALDRVGADTRDPVVRQLLAREREVVRAWFDEYAAPIVAAGVPGMDWNRATRGKDLFDELRLVNDAVAEAIAAERRNADRAAATARRIMYGTAVALGVAILVVGYAVARTGRRQLLAPLGRLSETIRRLAAGDRSARAEPVGAAELRTVIEALNDLAAQTETLLAAEKARAARAGLRQAVVAELRDLRDPPATVGRVAALIGAAVGADSVHSEIIIPGAGPVTVQWPAGTAELPADAVAEVLAGTSGQAVIRPGGGFAVKLCDGGDCEPGYLYVTRAGAAWGEAEDRLLTGVAREIERALHQLSVQRQQDRLITELRMLDLRKDVFIQTVTHELRTPLTSILGYAEMMADEDGDELDPLRKRALDAILRNAHRLQGTIGDLVLLDRPGSADLQSDVLDLAGVATVVHGGLSNAARAKDLDVGFDAGEGWVRGDRTQLQRALRKLMENAIKFTPPGGSVRWQLTADDHNVTLSVTDTGIGIPAEDVPGLFTPFHRAGNAMDQAVQGPGLGLAIVRDIVRDHGGTIGVQSVVGRGSTFTITLPAAPAPMPAQL